MAFLEIYSIMKGCGGNKPCQKVLKSTSNAMHMNKCDASVYCLLNLINQITKKRKTPLHVTDCMCCIFMSDISTKVSSFFHKKKNKYRQKRDNSAVNDLWSKKKNTEKESSSSCSYSFVFDDLSVPKLHVTVTVTVCAPLSPLKTL